MIDKHPALIARCASLADVVLAVRFAREHDLLTAVRGAGHNIAGRAVCDDGIVIDLSAMKAIRIAPASRTARVEAGCTLADFDHDAQVFQLAAPTGINSTTGIAGLTLGGGFGWLSRKFGMTVDNLLSADVVTANSELLTASQSQNPDLFWALRGGGGNFGVVTSFEFQLHEFGPTALCGLIFHPFEDAARLCSFYQEFVANSPDELSVWIVLRKAPPLPFLPKEWHGKEVAILAAFYAGDAEQGKHVVEPLRRFGQPIFDAIETRLYTEWQTTFDPLVSAGARNYWKSHNITQLSCGLFDALSQFTSSFPTPLCEVFLGQVGAAASRPAKDAMAYAHRDTQFVLNVHTRWEDPAQDSECIAWAREFFDKTSPFASGSVYVNFMPDDEQERVQQAYGGNYNRLAEIKRKYDPDNFFHLNQNIKPAS